MKPFTANGQMRGELSKQQPWIEPDFHDPNSGATRMAAPPDAPRSIDDIDARFRRPLKPPTVKRGD